MTEMQISLRPTLNSITYMELGNQNRTGHLRTVDPDTLNHDTTS